MRSAWTSQPAARMPPTTPAITAMTTVTAFVPYCVFNPSSSAVNSLVSSVPSPLTSYTEKVSFPAAEFSARFFHALPEPPMMIAMMSATITQRQ